MSCIFLQFMLQFPPIGICQYWAVCITWHLEMDATRKQYICSSWFSLFDISMDVGEFWMWKSKAKTSVWVFLYLAQRKMNKGERKEKKIVLQIFRLIQYSFQGDAVQCNAM